MTSCRFCGMAFGQHTTRCPMDIPDPRLPVTEDVPDELAAEDERILARIRERHEPVYKTGPDPELITTDEAVAAIDSAPRHYPASADITATLCGAPASFYYLVMWRDEVTCGECLRLLETKKRVYWRELLRWHKCDVCNRPWAVRVKFGHEHWCPDVR